jgi:pimeloyl-ACP methyl ester carboxylesterase
LEPVTGYAVLEAEIKELWKTEPQYTMPIYKLLSRQRWSLLEKTTLLTWRAPVNWQRDGRFEIIPEAGHAATVTHALQINQLIVSFLNLELTK